MYLASFEVKIKLKVPVNTEVDPKSLTVKEAKKKVIQEIPNTVLLMNADQLSKAIQEVNFLSSAHIR